MIIRNTCEPRGRTRVIKRWEVLTIIPIRVSSAGLTVRRALRWVVLHANLPTGNAYTVDIGIQDKSKSGLSSKYRKEWHSNRFAGMTLAPVHGELVDSKWRHMFQSFEYSNGNTNASICPRRREHYPYYTRPRRSMNIEVFERGRQ